jgi:hypothetical protein
VIYSIRVEGGAPHSSDRKSPFLRCIAAVVGPVGTGGNSERSLRRVFQALWKRWEILFGSSIFPPFPWRVSFHRPSCFFLFWSFFLSLHFPQENFALGCPRNDDRHLAPPPVPPLVRVIGPPFTSQSRASRASDNSATDEYARSCRR